MFTHQFSETTTRRYDLDWLRFIAIVILLFFHTGMWFTTWEWHVKNNETSTSFNYWMVWLHFWRMPLLLFISGAGTYMALSKRTPAQFAGERFKKLFIPLLFGMFVVVPPQIYYEHIKEYNSYWDFYKTVFNFVAYPKGSFSWHHLWFVAYLFVYALIALPFLTYLRSDKSEKFKNTISKILSSPAGMLFIPSVLILITQVVLRPYFPDEKHNLRDLSYFVYYFCFFLFGMIGYASPKLWQTIGAQRKHLLLGALFILIPFYGTYFHFRGIVHYPWSDDTVETIFDVCAIFLSWFTLITVIAFGQHYLNKPHPWLKYFNEGLYPFYILHQTVIIAIGYYICRLSWSMAAKFWSISLLTGVSCILIYLLLIRSNNVMRFFFGLKPKKNDQATEPVLKRAYLET
ncbi:MAG: acyltransferase family protein [Bacteroidetes bacterium]|nr:acyltransferase family protein [Bacteroidota bacterium]